MKFSSPLSSIKRETEEKKVAKVAYIRGLSMVGRIFLFTSLHPQYTQLSFHAITGLPGESPHSPPTDLFGLTFKKRTTYFHTQ